MPRINPSALNTQVPWCPSSIHTILRNERYRGHVVWDKTVKVRSKSGKRIYKRIAPEKWVVREVPDQRIVSDQLWASAQARTEIVKQIYGEIGSKGGMRGRSASTPYLFSGLLKCSECGANITIVSGRWRGRGDVVYRCPQNAYRGDAVCKKQRARVPQALEGKLLSGLQDQVMRPETVRVRSRQFRECCCPYRKCYPGRIPLKSAQRH